jgi:hypothetical protein
VLVVAGDVPDDGYAPLARVHDQVPQPRRVVWWRPHGATAPESFLPGATIVDDVGSIAPAVAAHRRGADDLLADVPPSPWRGLGEHGQGGEGMMGGVPFGRPMAMTADDRDGLALDPLSFSAGPYLPWWPALVALDATVQGDVVQAAALRRIGDAGGRRHTAPTARARARRHLVWLSEFLHVLGLHALARRSLRLASSEATTARHVRRLQRLLVGTGALRLATRGVGVVHVPGGATATDAETRWRRRLDDAAAMLTAGEDAAEPSSVPRVDVHWDDDALQRVATVLGGAPWDEAVTTIISLDLGAAT